MAPEERRYCGDPWCDGDHGPANPRPCPLEVGPLEDDEPDDTQALVTEPPC